MQADTVVFCLALSYTEISIREYMHGGHREYISICNSFLYKEAIENHEI